MNLTFTLPIGVLDSGQIRRKAIAVEGVAV